MSNREDIRSQMNTYFYSLPNWLKEPFLPLRENLSILFDIDRDDLAISIIDSIPTPSGWTNEQIEAFNTAKITIKTNIESLIQDKILNDPLQSEESLAMIAAAAERRAL